jgi:uncharacterized ferredoxin-like protein
MFRSIGEAKGEVIRNVARLCAAAALTAPKSGGQRFRRGKPPFIETVFFDDRATLLRLAGRIRQRGRERRQAIWLRDATFAERLDGALLIGLKHWYPPICDCGACGYATCAEFTEATRQRRPDSEVFEFKGPHCNLRDINPGIAVGSAAKAASPYNIDKSCQTRVAVAAGKPGRIQAEIAVARSMTVTRKNPGFDAQIPDADFDAPAAMPAAPTGTVSVRTADGRWQHRPDLEPGE